MRYTHKETARLGAKMEMRINIGRFCPLVMGSLLACSSQDMALASAADTSSGADDALDTGDTTADDDTDAMWWKCSANLHLSEGAIDLDHTLLSVSFFDSEMKEMCLVEASATKADAVDETVDPALLALWEFVPGDWTGDCESETLSGQLPSSIQLGVGALDDEIVAVMGTSDLVSDGAESSLNGAYASIDGGTTLWVYGLAGTLAAYDGLGATQTETPLDDGMWLLRPLYSFPI